MLRRVADWLNQRSPSTLTVMGLVMAAVVGVADRRTPAELSFAIFYLVPILFVTWLAGRRAGVFIAVACGIAWFAADLTQPVATWKSFIPYWNLMSRTAVFLAVAFILSLVKALNEELEAKVERRTRDLKVSILKHRLTEERLRTSELRFRQVTESIREVFWVTDAQKNQMVYISPGYEQIWGRTCESLYAAPDDWMKAIHDEDRDRVRRAALTKQPSGEYDEEYRIVRPDGSIRWIHDRAFPVRGDDGNVYRIAGIAEDITERKREEAEVAILAHAVECTAELICITDSQDRFIFANRAFQLAHGYTLEEILGRTPEILYSPRNPPSLLAEVLKQTRLGHWQGEVLDRRKDGTEFPIWLSTSLVKDRTGQLIGLLGVARDISERKQAEISLATLAQAVESTGELICITDLEDRFIFANRAFQEAYGYTQAELVGRTPEILFSPHNPLSLVAEILEQTRLGGWRGEALDRRKDGTEFPIRLSTSLVKDRSGEVIGLMGVAQDITERKQLEKQIVEISDREQARIGQDLHDDLCQQLISIAFACKILEGKLWAKSLSEAAQAGDIAHVLDGAITKAREVARGLYPVKIASGGLSSALRELATDVSSQLHIDCAAECAENVLANDIAVATHLYRIAQEAVTNAVRHSRATHIVIGLHLVGGAVTLSVSDNGIGMPAEFDSLTGMGLHTMQYRARIVGGRLEIERRECGGTRVICSIHAKAS